MLAEIGHSPLQTDHLTKVANWKAKRLPVSGENWPNAHRKLWLQLLEGSFDLIYTDKSSGKQGDEADFMK